MNLTPIPAFCHPCGWGAGHRSGSFQSAGEHTSLSLERLGILPWPLDPVSLTGGKDVRDFWGGGSHRCAVPGRMEVVLCKT